MAKRALLFLLTIFLTFSFSVGVVMAQPATETPPSDNSNSTTTAPPTTDPNLPASETNESTSTENARIPVWSNMYDNDQEVEYLNAIRADNCATPSLECLVHQTTRFIAIEWVNSMISPKKGESKEGADAKINENSGAITTITSLISTMYAEPPAKTSRYVADVMESAHIVPKAYAQGLGFSSLNPVLNLWKAFRNIAYMFFIVVIVVIGFMIMFKRGDGQASVTAMQAIPNVIVSLLFVTFSYAIAGLLIDGMYLTMYMIIGIFTTTVEPGTISNRIIDYNIFKLMYELFHPVQTNQVIRDMIDVFLTDMTNSQNFGEYGGFLTSLTFTVIITVAILIGTFRLFFELLKSYSSIVISVVTAPIVLMFGAIPGRKNVFMDWIWDLVGNLSAFPTVMIVVVLYYQLTEIGIQANSGGFLPPFLINSANQMGLIGSLMGLAIVLALPDIVKDIKKRLGASESAFGMMIANAATKRFQEGWKGGNLVEGLDWTNTARIPIIGSGKSQFQSMYAAPATVVGHGLKRAMSTMYKPTRMPGEFGAGIAEGVESVVSNPNEKFWNIFKKPKKKSTP